MPLEFDSLSHGKVAFGFFNIETDMILLDRYFLFARDFCEHISESAQDPSDESYESSWDIYLIENDRDAGNLMGAIYGTDLRGFIGAVYKFFPFPKEREKFRQNPEGFKTRSLMEKLIEKYGKRTKIRFLIRSKHDEIGIGEYLFNRISFRQLIEYIWMGGFPRWRDGIQPDYVLTMKQRIAESPRSVFEGLTLA